MTASEYLKSYELNLRCKFESEATIQNYLDCSKSFFRFAAGKTGIEPAELLKQYLVWGLKGKSARTINLHRSAIVKFFEIVKGVSISTHDVPRRKQPKSLPSILPQQTIHAALAKEMNLKHRLIIALYYGCGMRLSEVQYMRKSSVVIEKNILRLTDTKGERERIVPVPATIRELLYGFIAEMQFDQLIFGNLCKETFYKIVKNAFCRIGVRAHPHMLRHSYATHQIQSGQSVFKLQKWLGHGNIKTTEVYVHLGEAELSESTDLLANGN